MNKTRSLVLALPTAALLLFATSLSAQHLEAGALTGFSNYLGDLSNNSGTVYLKESLPVVGLLAKYNMSERLAFRLGLNFTRLSGRDANVRRDDFVRERNLSFRTGLIEVGLTAEFNILGYQPYALSRPFSPFIFAGVAYTKFNPKARYEGNWVALQPLGTEGQGMAGFDEKYSLSTISIPFGVGVKYAITDKLNLGIELGARRSFTDYLDDVSGDYVAYTELLAGNGQTAANLGNRTSELLGGEPVELPTGTQRGDLAKKDWYFILGFTVTYNFLDNGLMGGRQRGRRRSGCNT